MKERGILFSTPMVRALLGGSKKQTLRPLKGTALEWLDQFTPEFVADPENHMCPYGAAGDRVWVREAWWASSAHDALPPRDIPAGDAVEYAADPERVLTGKLRPSIFMPRWASRITLEVASVRIERLQAISVHDAIAEGIPAVVRKNPDGIQQWDYRDLWEQINGAGAWDANPSVWAVEFKRVDQ